MKNAKPVFYLGFVLTMLSCGGNTNGKGTSETTAGETHATSLVAQEPAASSNAFPGDSITGYWKLYLEAYDDNGNRKLDDEERKKGIKNRYSFRFNADGSCEIMELFKGRYEIETENGKKLLHVYRNRVAGEEEKDPPPDVYEITSMSKEELVLLEKLGEHTFLVFRK